MDSIFQVLLPIQGQKEKQDERRVEACEGDWAGQWPVSMRGHTAPGRDQRDEHGGRLQNLCGSCRLICHGVSSPPSRYAGLGTMAPVRFPSAYTSLHTAHMKELYISELGGHGCDEQGQYERRNADDHGDLMDLFDEDRRTDHYTDHGQEHLADDDGVRLYPPAPVRRPSRRSLYRGSASSSVPSSAHRLPDITHRTAPPGPWQGGSGPTAFRLGGRPPRRRANRPARRRTCLALPGRRRRSGPSTPCGF